MRIDKGHERRWDPCIAHYGDDVDKFLLQYFSQPDRKVLFVAGAGFDPRSCIVATCVSNVAKNIRALFIRESRPRPSRDQLDQAQANTNTLCNKLADSKVVSITIFGSDNAIVGGRNVVAALGRESLDDVTDVIVDVSALSAGTSLPIIRYFIECILERQSTTNLHLFVVHSPGIDSGIRSVVSDAPSYVHGFKGGSTLSGNDHAARLWLPQFETGQRAAFDRLHGFINPHDTCPIFPFPAVDPRMGDVLAAEYLMEELETHWSIDARNIIYANGGGPLDLYRTILTLHDRRKPVFLETGGSMLVLSPLGSKVMALGAALAALERDLPVAYLESIDYELKLPVSGQVQQPYHLIHLWLEGDVYPQPRPRLPEDMDII